MGFVSGGGGVIVDGVTIEKNLSGAIQVKDASLKDIKSVLTRTYGLDYTDLNDASQIQVSSSTFTTTHALTIGSLNGTNGKSSISFDVYGISEFRVLINGSVEYTTSHNAGSWANRNFNYDVSEGDVIVFQARATTSWPFVRNAGIKHSGVYSVTNPPTGSVSGTFS